MSSHPLPIADDPALVPGVYNHCDQWCSYCQLTARCLVHRIWLEWRQRGHGEFSDFADVIAFTREVAAAAGATTPELDALLSPNPADRAGLDTVDDPLERLGREYAGEASRFLQLSGWMAPPENGWPLPQPAPLDVVAWYHVFIAAKVYRALASEAQGARGRVGMLEDANGSAKVALVGIDRSRAAFRRLAHHHDVPRIARILALLDRLGSGLEARFPDARAFPRPGLDAAIV